MANPPPTLSRTMGYRRESMAFKDEGYDDERFWEQVRSENATFLGFWTHR